MFTDAYLRKVDAVCVHYSNRIGAIPNFYGGGSVKKMDARLSQVDSQIQAFMADFNGIKTPKKWQSFSNAAAKDLAAIDVAVGHYATAVKPNSSAASVLAAETTYRQAARAPGKSLNKRMDSHGLFRCGSAF
jgi:hypothetical protein